MNAARRVARLEESLLPRQAVLRWMAEAHRWPSINAYARSTVDRTDALHPLPTLLRRVEAATTRLARGREDRGRAVREAIRDTVFLYYLVLETNASIARFTEVETLRAMLVVAHADDQSWLGGVSNRNTREEQPRARAEAHPWTALAWAVLQDIATEADALATLERRYLGGQRLLFADTARSWGQLEEQAQVLDMLANPRRGNGRGCASDRPARDAISDGAAGASRVAELVDDARLAAYEWLGEAHRARKLLESRLVQPDDRGGCGKDVDPFRG